MRSRDTAVLKFKQEKLLQHKLSCLRARNAPRTGRRRGAELKGGTGSDGMRVVQRSIHVTSKTVTEGISKRVWGFADKG